jgi:hypothetical protein
LPEITQLLDGVLFLDEVAWPKEMAAHLLYREQ